MSSAIEETVKALVEFEAELDSAKAEVLEVKRKTMKDATDWAEGARASAISRAQEIASARVARAKQEAEADARRIKEKGESDLRAFESSMSRNKSKATEVVKSRLLGESE